MMMVVGIHMFPLFVFTACVVWPRAEIKLIIINQYIVSWLIFDSFKVPPPHNGTCPIRQPVRLLADASPYNTEMLFLVPNRDALRDFIGSSARGDLIISCTFTKTSSPYGFAVSGPTEWNSLLKNLKNKERRWRRGKRMRTWEHEWRWIDIESGFLLSSCWRSSTFKVMTDDASLILEFRVSTTRRRSIKTPISHFALILSHNRILQIRNTCLSETRNPLSASYILTLLELHTTLLTLL